jgi:hypothetical protein
MEEWERCQTACKPGSVRAPRIATEGARRPFLWDAPRGAPRATNPGDGAGMPLRQPDGSLRPASPVAPIRSCSRWGLPCRPCCQGRGALLPHRFALARGLPDGACAGGLFSVALSLGSPPPAVSRHRFPVEPGLSSDTPGLAWRYQRPSGRLAAHDMCEKRQESKNGRVHTEDAESTEHHRERMNALRAKHALGLDPRAPFSSSVPPSWFSVLSV